MNVEEVIEKVKEAAKNVWNDLKAGWAESVYQNAMEVALRERGVVFESQRILPVFYRDNNREYCVGEGIPDLIVWAESGKNRTAVIIDLKADTNIKEEHVRQIQKYIEALKKQLKKNEQVHQKGLVINFAKESSKKVQEDLLVKEDGLEIFEQDISAILDKSKSKDKEE